MKKDLIEMIVENIEKIEPKNWEHFLSEKATRDIYPYNPFSKTLYSGINLFHLYIARLVKGFESNKFATFKQISAANGQVQKGAKSVWVQYVDSVFRHIDTGEAISKKAFANLPAALQENYKSRTFVKLYNVFNLDLVQGLDVEKFDFTSDEDFIPHPDLEKYLTGILKNNRVICNRERTDRAYYSPGSDSITLPKKKLFKDSDTYYGTIFHELIHWTGHKSRLDRQTGKIFGDTKYAYEELIAELGSMLILFNNNVLSQFPNSLIYLKGWLSSCEDKKVETLREAFKEAFKAVKFLETR